MWETDGVGFFFTSGLILYGLRVDFIKSEGLFCKFTGDVRPEALFALLLGEDISLYFWGICRTGNILFSLLAKESVRCNGKYTTLS